ncbi:hypothetical protein [Microcoleus sp. CAWBG58]|uniref:hypothetical protein n=1 Tax=Microcoleus sp. CAWBG58 TaxID=2841651 RepID=UPI0025F407B5|nr:hypothetical protein [Microcoleus sp. CAWBG58]
MTKRSQRNASIEQLWESDSACAAGTALLAAPIALAKSILFVNQESIDKALFRSDGARRSPQVKNPDRNWGQDKLKTSKASKVGEIKKLDRTCI